MQITALSLTDFAPWATTLAGALLPLALPVVNQDLRGRAWGLCSKTTGIHLDLGAMQREATGPWQWAAVGIAIHEVAHGAGWRRPHLLPTLPPTQAAETVVRWAARVDEPEQVPWAEHGADFVRLALHCHHRAERHLGVTIALESLAACPTDFGLSNTIFECRRALGDEPQAMASETWAVVRSTAPPRAFQDLWRHDVTVWLDSIPEPTEKQHAACAAALTLFS